MDPDWWVAAGVLLAGCWIQTALGFGMAVLAAPVIVLVEPSWVPMVLTVVALMLSIFNTWDQRQHFQWDLMRWPMLTRIPGTILGAWLLSLLSAAWLQILVACCVLVAVVVSFLGRRAFTPRKSHMGWAGFTSGLMGTTTSIGGPPMALVMQHGDPRHVRANLSAYFLYSCTLSLISYFWLGLMPVELVVTSLSLLPISLLGFYLGIKARPFVDGGRFRPLLLLLCSLAGLAALLGALKRLWE